jgi:hypothetical protein
LDLPPAKLVDGAQYGFAGWQDLTAEVSNRLGKRLEWAVAQARRIIHDNDGVKRRCMPCGAIPELQRFYRRRLQQTLPTSLEMTQYPNSGRRATVELLDCVADVRVPPTPQSGLCLHHNQVSADTPLQAVRR